MTTFCNGQEDTMKASSFQRVDLPLDMGRLTLGPALGSPSPEVKPKDSPAALPGYETVEDDFT